jgi:hypothetical protein
MLEGTLYDVLPYEFHDERNAAGEYVPLRQRRPSVRYPLARVVVEDSLSLLFGDGHFPTIDSADREVRFWLGEIGREAGLNRVMLEAGLLGSLGSVAVLVRVLGGRVFFEALGTRFLTPVFDPLAPDTLLCVTERYKVAGAVLAARGYQIAEPRAEYWFERRWDAEAETWFQPLPVGDDAAPVADAGRSVRHGLGFVPLVWVRNLPGGDPLDGGCTFRAAAESSIEIDYQLSQAGRGLKYSADPTLMIREPAGVDGALLRGAGNALVLSEKGDAKLLEIDGAASGAVIEYVRALRELALEAVHGNRASPERLAAAQSGRALELMNQGLVWLADRLRVGYGAGLLRLARMVLLASRRFPLTVAGRAVPALEAGAALSLCWPRWYPPTAGERAADAGAVATLVGAGVLSREAAVKAAAGDYGIDDVGAELAHLQAENTA